MRTPPDAAKKNSGGRPPKFKEPSRPVTVTLPESVLKTLQKIDEDRGKAIVKLARGSAGKDGSAPPLVEVVQMASNLGVLIVGPSAALRRIPFLHLVEVAPSRFLLALDPGNDYRTLELAIHDVLEDVPEDDFSERELIAKLLEAIRHMRKAELVSMAEILLVKLGKS